MDDHLPDADLFRVEAVPDHLKQITTLLITNHCPEGYTTTQKQHLIVRATYYQLIIGHLYKMGLDQVLRQCILQHEREYLLWECHVGVARGHVGVKPLQGRYCKQDYGGWPFIKILKNMLRAVMSICGLESRPDGMSNL